MCQLTKVANLTMQIHIQLYKNIPNNPFKKSRSTVKMSSICLRSIQKPSKIIKYIKFLKLVKSRTKIKINNQTRFLDTKKKCDEKSSLVSHLDIETIQIISVISAEVD